MAEVLILGGTGYTGRKIARHLLAQSGASVVIASRHLDQAEAFADALNHDFHEQRAGAVFADAADKPSLLNAFQNRALVVVASPTTAHTENIVRACLEVGVDYLDIQLSIQKLTLLQSLAGEIKGSGRCFVTEAGYHPGLPAAQIRYAAEFLDQIENAVCAGFLNMGIDLPYSEAFDELAEYFRKYPGQVFKNSAWTREGSSDMRKFNFGGDIGLKQVFSMFLEELRPLPELYPSLKEVGFYVAESHWLVDYIIMPITLVWLKITPKAIHSIGRFLWWGMRTFHRPPYRVELQVHAAGIKDGRVAEVLVGISHSDGYELTAIPVVATLLQYLDGTARKPGLWMMGHLIEPNRFMKDMKNMGVQVQVEGV